MLFIINYHKINNVNIETSLDYKPIANNIYPLGIVLKFKFKEEDTSEERVATISFVFESPDESSSFIKLLKSQEKLCVVSSNNILLTNTPKVFVNKDSNISGILKITNDGVSFTFLEDNKTYIIYDNIQEIEHIFYLIEDMIYRSFRELMNKRHMI